MKKLFLAALLVVSTAAIAQPEATSMRLRGTVEKADATTLVVKLRSGDSVSLSYADNFGVTEVLPIDPAAIQSGTFVGTAAVAAADGSLSALEVLVFPEAARGTGEGHSPWDLQPGATMTNATVASVTPEAGVRVLTLRYKDGEKTIRVRDGVPIVTLKPADRSLLVPGARVMVVAQVRDGNTVAMRALAGRNGFEPPM